MKRFSYFQSLVCRLAVTMQLSIAARHVLCMMIEGIFLGAQPAMRWRKYVVLSFGFFSIVLFAVKPVVASTLTVLHAFKDSDGSHPHASLIESQGSYYGTTPSGGDYGNGTVYKISPSGELTTVYSFTGKHDGNDPFPGLVADRSGNLYGTTLFGGSTQNGVVYKIAADGKQSVVYSFKGGTDARAPYCTLLIDSDGNLLGATPLGGLYDKGTIFKITPQGTESILYSFGHSRKDASGGSSLTMDAEGNLYGVGGGGALNQGTVFEFTTDDKEKILYSFSLVNNDGTNPIGPLLRDAAGNLYGTAEFGGSNGAGTVFKVSPKGREKVLHQFTGGSDGCTPTAALISDHAGNLYGTTSECGTDAGYGTVFKIAKNGTFKTLYAFPAPDHGVHPLGGLLIDANGNLFGTTSEGGTIYGTVFKLKQ